MYSVGEYPYAYYPIACSTTISYHAEYMRMDATPPPVGDVLAALADLTHRIATTTDYHDVIDGVAARVAMLLGAERCVLWLLDAARETLVLAGSAYGCDPCVGTSGRRVAVEPGSPLDRALHGQDTIVASEERAELCRALDPSAPAGLCIALPSPHGPLGLLYLALPAPAGEPEPGEFVMTAARIVAAQLGLALAGARALAAALTETAQASAQAARLALVQETARELSAITTVHELCDRIVQTIYARMGRHVAGVFVREDGALRLAAYSMTDKLENPLLRLPIGTGIIGHVAATNQPYLCRDTYADPHFHRASDTGSRSEAAVPMRAGGAVIGVLNVESLTPNAFDDDDVATLAAIADQAAIAIQNARLYEAETELRRRAEVRARRLAHVQRVGEGLKMDLDEADIGARVVAAACEALGFRIAVLNLVDHPGDPDSRARVVATSGLPPEGEQALRAHDFSITAVQDVFRPEYRLSRSYFVPEEAGALTDAGEVTTWTLPIENRGPNAWRAGDELLVPLTDRRDGHLLGFLSVDDPESGQRPEREEVEVLEIFADQAIVALRNARLLAQARQQAERDPVTGLYNHRAAHVRLEATLATAIKEDSPVGLLALDMDDFKLINDTYGHPTGDMALRHVALLLDRCARDSDIAARLGGDEFLLILPGASHAHSVDVAERLALLAQETPLRIDGVGFIPLRMSIGVAACPDDATQSHTLLTIADTRLYEAKRSGGRAVESGIRVERDGVDLDGFDMLSALVAAVDNKDRYTREHSEQVAHFACILADRLGLSTESLRTLRMAGLLHDVGKIGVPDRILRKPGQLEAHEWDIMKSHATLSATLLRAVGGDPDVLTAVAHHHERWDGQGYPAGLAGTGVPLLGRVMIVADAVSAMAMDRPYRKGLSPDTIARELRKGAGTQFDPALVEPFIATLDIARGEVA